MTAGRHLITGKSLYFINGLSCHRKIWCDDRDWYYLLYRLL